MSMLIIISNIMIYLGSTVVEVNTIIHFRQKLFWNCDTVVDMILKKKKYIDSNILW